MYYVEAPYYIYHAECNTEKFVIFPTAESVVELKKASMIFFKKLNSEDLLPLLSFAIFIHHTLFNIFIIPCMSLKTITRQTMSII